MTLIVTGAAGFIGSNFVLNWLSNKSEKIIALDKLTYAGNLGNLESVQNNTDFQFIKGDIGDSELMASVLKEIILEQLSILQQKAMWIDLFMGRMILCKLILLALIDYWKRQDCFLIL